MKKNNNILGFSTHDSEKVLFWKLIISFFIGIFVIIGYSVGIADAGLSLSCLGVLLALSTFITGFFIGTLFGMPKRNDAINKDYSLNNSLVEISDWLTKIIVGLGLVNLKQIPIALMSMGAYVSKSSNQSLDIFTICIVVYFSILGLYIGYNYMRLVLSQKYKLADDNILKEEIDKLELSLEKEQKQKNILLENFNSSNVEDEKSLQEEYVVKMREKAKDKLKKGLEEYPMDPQKKQWGGRDKSNDRILNVQYEELFDGAYKLTLKIESSNPTKLMKEGDITLFALHSTFGQEPFRFVRVNNGKAEYQFVSYGAFTVGAFADRGETELEFDLLQLPNTSEYFKSH